LRTLQDIYRDMEDWAKPSDPEIAHSFADDLLVEALRYLAKNTANAPMIEQIIQQYEAVEKHFA